MKGIAKSGLIGALMALGGLLIAAPGHAAAAERVYELASPVDKNGINADTRSTGASATVGVSPDGDAVAYSSVATFPHVEGGSVFQQYASFRDSDGWVTREGYSPSLGVVSFGTLARVALLSEDLTKALVGTPAALVPEAENLGDTWGFYLRDASSTPATNTLLKSPEDELSGGSGNPPSPGFGAATDDFSHIAFTSRRQLLPSGPPDGEDGVYEWHDGELRLAGVLPDGGGPAEDATVGRPGPASTTTRGENAISEDGSSIFFTDGGPSGELYVREDASETRIVDPDETSGCEADDLESGGNARFHFATADGSQAFFMSSVKLTEDATEGGAPDLYRWNGEAPPCEQLTDLTTQDSDGAGIEGIAGAADDGTHAYFVATGELASGAQPGENNLYAWQDGDQDGDVSLVAVLGPDDGAVWSRSLSSVEARYRDARISADGSRLMFASREQLTSYDNDGFRQIYLYDAGTEALRCVSCNPLQDSSTADATIYDQYRGFDATIKLPRNLSDDGSRVFFQTPERLVEDDVNNRIDVYEWEEGEVSLVSDGVSAEHARFIGASADGDDVFFTTAAQLSPWDEDELTDVYAARIGGGLPGPPDVEPCIGEECRPPESGAPSSPQAGSRDVRGAGNAQARQVARCAGLIRMARHRVAAARQVTARSERFVRRARAAIGRDTTAAPVRRRAIRRADMVRQRMQRARTAARITRQAARRCVRG